jgi:hypothetical protein
LSRDHVIAAHKILVNLYENLNLANSKDQRIYIKFLFTPDKEGKPSFAISKPVIVVYDDENLEVKMEKVLAHIVWLLEAQKSEKSSQSDEQTRHPKKQRLASNLAGESG